MDYDERALHHVRETRFLIDAYDSWLMSEVEPYFGDRVIEIGCGLGNLFAHLTDKELVVGIDNSRRAIQEAMLTFSKYPNVKLFALSITDPEVVALRRYQFDTALSLNVFEHIEDDVLAMKHSYNLLQPSGHFILIVPAHQLIYGTMDQSIGHYRRYSKQAVREKLERVGFSVIDQKYINMLGALGWFFNAKIFRRKIPPSSQLMLINRLIPILRRFESAVQVPIGISLLTVAQSA